MPKLTKAGRAKAKLLYADASIPIVQIAARLGVCRGTISRLAKSKGWLRTEPAPALHSMTIPSPPATGSPPPVAGASSLPAPPDAGSEAPRPSVPDGRSRQELFDRLYRLIQHNITRLESRMSDDDNTDDREPERDMRVIGNLVRSVEKLKDLETEQSKRDASATSSGRAHISAEEEDRIRRKVVEHILRLRERKRADERDS